MKYVQKVIPEITSKIFSGKSVGEIRKSVFDFYKNNYQNKSKIINVDTGITIEFDRIGNKRTTQGGAMYPDKACVIKILDKLIKYAKYNNWGERKTTDPVDVVGYLNFKAKVRIDGKLKFLRIAIRLKNTGKFHYSIDVNKWK